MDIHVDLLKLKAYKLFKNSDADLSWLLCRKLGQDYHLFVAFSKDDQTLDLSSFKSIWRRQIKARNFEI